MLINRNDAISKLQELKGHSTGLVASVFDTCIQAVGEMDTVEVVHGRWEPRTDVVGFVRCSVCHDCNVYDDWADGKKWNYCPNCGAKMDGERKTNESTDH